MQLGVHTLKKNVCISLIKAHDIIIIQLHVLMHVIIKIYAIVHFNVKMSIPRRRLSLRRVSSISFGFKKFHDLGCKFKLCNQGLQLNK